MQYEQTGKRRNRTLPNEAMQIAKEVVLKRLLWTSGLKFIELTP